MVLRPWRSRFSPSYMKVLVLAYSTHITHIPIQVPVLANTAVSGLLLTSKTIPIAADETGQLMGGYIHLHGWLRSASWARYPPSFEASLELQSDGKEPYHTPSSIIVWPDRFDNTTVWIDEFDTNGAENRTHPVYCLPVHIWWNQDGDRCTEGLILAEAGGEWNKTFFRRVGRFKIPLTDKESQDAFYGNAIEDLRRNAFSETGGLLKEGEWTII